MVHVDDQPHWCPRDAIVRLRIAADRLCPSSVPTDVSVDGGSDEITLPKVLALCDRDALDPGSEEGRYFLVVAVTNETRKRLHLLAMLSGPAECKKIERNADKWVAQCIAGVEREIGELWAEPVAGLIGQKHEEPGLFVRVLSEFDVDESSCPDVNL